MPSRIRVLFAIGSLAGGGSERQLVTILQHLDRARFEPHLYLVERRGELLGEVPDDVPVRAFWDRHAPPRWNFPGAIRRLQVRDLASVLREERIDVVYDRTYHMTLIAGAAARQAGVPRISVIVTEPKQGFEQNERRFAGIKRLLLKRAYRSAARVIAVSEGVREAANDYYGLAPTQIVTMPNLLDVERVERLSHAASPELEQGRFLIVSAGRLHEEKGQTYLIEAVRQLVHEQGRSTLLLLLLGEGPSEQQLKRQVASAGLAEHVRFAGYVANPYPLLRQAQLFCLPSLYEGMPNALLEALACGIPVLATESSGTRAVLERGQLGRLVPPANATKLAEAIDDAWRHPEAWRSVAADALGHVLREYSFARGIAALEETLASVAAH